MKTTIASIPRAAKSASHEAAVWRAQQRERAKRLPVVAVYRPAKLKAKGVTKP